MAVGASSLFPLLPPPDTVAFRKEGCHGHGTRCFGRAFARLPACVNSWEFHVTR